MELRFEIFYHPDVVRNDLPRISAPEKHRIRRAIEQKLAFFPQEFGVPLRHTLKGYWKLRVGDGCVICKVHGTALTSATGGRFTGNSGSMQTEDHSL